jgi:hypothetical protein
VEHTWHRHPLPKLETSNLESGDVAVCGSFTKPAEILGGLDRDRVAFVAPLGSRSDLEWLLRELCLHTNVRHLVIVGDDLRATGQALLDLWQEGLGEQGRLPGSRGSFPADLDVASLDTLRGYVAAWDHRGEPLAEAAKRISELPALSREVEPRSLPTPVIPERKVFLSRKTTFPIFSNDVGDAWLQLLNLTLRVGTEQETAGGERLAEALNAVVTLEAPSGEEAFPAFLDFNRDDFDRYYRLDAACDRLTASLDTNSGGMAFLEPQDLAGPNTPNLVSATFNSLDQKLFGSFVLRSADVYSDWPLEAMALLRLQREVAERVGLESGPATFVLHAACLHERDWARALRVLDEHFKRPLPLQVDPSGIFLFGNDGGQARAMLLDHDANTILWEQAFSDPEDLSWYIVDVMPWLLPQHIRYVGQECASLMRAIREGECYEQG